MSGTVRVLLIDASFVVRAGLRIALHEGGHTEVAGEAATGQAAVRLAAELRPDVVIMDCALLDMDGGEAIRRIKAAAPQVRVLIFSSALSGLQIQAALRAGADGILLRHCALKELHAAVLRVAAGHRVLHPEVLQALHGLAGDSRRVPSLDTLSEREREVLGYLAAGATSKEIALTLRLSPKTIENHRSRILEKLGVNSTAAAVRVAVAHGLIDAFAPASAWVLAPVGEGTPRSGR